MFTKLNMEVWTWATCTTAWLWRKSAGLQELLACLTERTPICVLTSWCGHPRQKEILSEACLYYAHIEPSSLVLSGSILY